MGEVVCGNDIINRENPVEWFWPYYVKKRVGGEKKLSFVAMITARPGKGKSWSSLTFATLCDDTFVQDVVAHGIGSRIARKLSNLGRMIQPPDVKPGTCFILEEGGVNANSKDAMRRSVRAYENILQVARYKRLIILINAPYKNLYIKVGRNLLDAEFKVLYRIRNWNVVKPTQNQYVPEVDKIYNPFLKLRSALMERKINRLWLPKPPQVVIDAYTKFEEDFKQQIIDGAVNVLEQCELEEGEIREEDVPEVNTVCLRCGLKWHRIRKSLPMKCPSPDCKALGSNIRNFSGLTPEQIAALPKNKESQ
jgi:hypothetical protein